MSDGIITINGKQIPINGERSILELAKKAGIDYEVERTLFSS